ncbi:hypothetical protein HAD_05325 [Hyphomonas adhaerens MHS-3]|uniref:Uncharacterized protein n=1 Tax=Hyphomonas adhaerens MHS-3 TaxID=1280949 RepID=A0A069E912_9PROT|nr:hypothetical protein [Hyphomonas adhaerens]KCZ85076.1 hypothetical protein HAD_05325 [Hyphomonas adhaerens MHS-3]
MSNKLSDHWLRDQSFAFAATLLGDYDPEIFEPRQSACAMLLAQSVDTVRAGLISDSTLSLISTIDESYVDESFLAKNGWNELTAAALPLGHAVLVAREELSKRDEVSANGLNRVLISHAVYVLKRRHMTAVKFLKWLQRAVPGAVPGVDRAIQNIRAGGAGFVERVEQALAASRDADLQTRDRLEEIDRFHDLILDAAEADRDLLHPWWTRICMAYRSSLFCWPLLIEGNSSDDESAIPTGRGLSLPVSLFLLEDGKSSWKSGQNFYGQRIWFKYKLSKTEEKFSTEPRFREARDELPAHIDGFHFGFTQEWWTAFAIGVDVAKKLWSSQNGRLRFADKQAAQAKLQASLNVDLRAACDIVESVYSLVPDNAWKALRPCDRFFMVGDRSAEAYWVQCVLGLLLPAREIPLGLCTGRVEYLDGEFEMEDVAGVVAKLEYANRAGVPRVVLPGDRQEYFEGGVDDEKESSVQAEVAEFLDRIAADQSRKTLEINFARSARAAADAMQSAGWRRTSFLRTAGLQKTLSYHQHRLFIRDLLKSSKLKRRLKKKDVEWYNNHRKWFDVETEQLEDLDSVLLSSAKRSVKYVYGNQLIGKIPGASIEQTLGKWIAWKDNQIRSGEETGYRGPGLGVLALRTADGDREIRVWAALSEMLDADDGWWDQFQWSDLPMSAQFLAQLLCNQRADPTVSVGSAPDLIIIFDDAGMTQTRTNVVFPKNFHHQFFDLLNPRHPENHKRDFLDEALKRFGGGALNHPTRIIVVLPGDEELSDNRGSVLEQADRDILERLAVFRFGFSRQAAFSMANFRREVEGRLSWKEFELAAGRLIKNKLLTGSRDILVVPSATRKLLGDFSLLKDPDAHQHAAESLCPILNPKGVRISANRDRQLEPESILEADWHLQRAYSLVPWRFQPKRPKRNGRPRVADSQALLTFLRTSPDWDTVKRLRVNSKTRKESLDLCKELFDTQRTLTGQQPQSTTIALYIETLGRLYRNEQQRQDQIDSLADDIVYHVDTAIEHLKSEELSKSEWQRRLRHLFSRQVFALRMLGLPLTDHRVAGSKSYLDNAITEILERDFIGGLGEDLGGLDDYPISHDFWRCMWSDGKDEGTPNKTLSLNERSTYAYAAARASLGQRRVGRPSKAPWDEPWIAYFILTQPEYVAAAQLVGPLSTWREIYGSPPESASGFGSRVLNLQPHAKKRKGKWEEAWSGDILGACLNLWSYLTHPDNTQRLFGAPVAPALDLIRVLALEESLPAYLFLKQCGTEWLDRFATIVTQSSNRWSEPAHGTYGFVAEAWTTFGNTVVGLSAGWIAMLDSLDGLADDDARLFRVTGWLRAFEAARIDNVRHSDPENLAGIASNMPSIQDFRNAAFRAKRNADHIFKLRNARGWALYGHYRMLLSEIVRSVPT